MPLHENLLAGKSGFQCSAAQVFAPPLHAWQRPSQPPQDQPGRSPVSGGGGVLGAVAVVVTSDFAAFFGAKKSEIMLRLDAILTPGRSNTGRVWCLRELTGVCNNSKALVRIPASVISIEEQEPINRGAN